MKKLKILNIIKLFKLTIVLSVILFQSAYAQVYTNKPVGKKNETLQDSIKTTEYQYSLPIWGKKATKAGFDLPYSAGVSVQYLWMKQDLVIDNLEVGFNNSPKVNLDEIIRFDNSVAEAQGVNLRPDVWLFPFLNVYGIFAKSKPSTTVGFGLWIPDSSGTSKEILNISTKAEFDAVSIGFGMTPTIGIAGGFLALDMNFTWTDVDALDKPAFSFIFDPRLGKSIKFKNHPQRNVALWVGGFRWSINSGTTGSLPLNEVLPVEDLGTKIDDAYLKVDDAQQQIDTWWSNLSPVEQQNPINKAKFASANSALEKAGYLLSSADAAIANVQTSTVQYSLEKRPAEKWNFLIGGQFQLNKHWMVRAEYGFLGSREQFMSGLQYRFGL